MDPKAKIESLSEQIRQHNYNYYVLAKPSISDYDFDMLLEELESLEAQYPEFQLKDSPTLRVGGEITKEFPTFIHIRPMLSLGNSYSKEEILEFDQSVQKLAGGAFYNYLLDHKFDGVSLSLHYRQGLLQTGVTRGNGVSGDDITANAKTIPTVPLRLRGIDYPEEVEIRGEVLMLKDDFNSLNRERIASDLSPLMNPRNSTAGTLKMQDSSIVAKRKLYFFAYSVLSDTPLTETDEDHMKLLHSWGFKLSGAYEVCQNVEEVINYLDRWDKKKEKLAYGVDGVVIKVNQISLRDELGTTAKAPRWAIAYKYKAEEAITTVLSVDYQVGRTGKITPVANLSPVLLAGTTVKRASLHNEDEIKRLDLHIGDKVRIEKGGDIIPKITAVLIEERELAGEAVIFPTNCPECQTPLIKEEGEANHYCPNESGCPPQIKGRIQHFASRQAMDIEGLGKEVVNQLVDAKLINTYSDLYKLTYDQIINLDRFADTSVRNLLNGIENSKKQPFERVLYGLGIRFVGATVAKKLVKYLKSIDMIRQATLEELEALPDIGQRIARSVKDFFSSERHQNQIEELKSAGLQLHEKEKNPQSGKLNGKSFVISGVFLGYSREEIKEKIEVQGGIIKSSLSSKTNYLLAGQNAGPSKLSKAEKLGVDIITEEDFLRLL